MLSGFESNSSESKRIRDGIKPIEQQYGLIRAFPKRGEHCRSAASKASICEERLSKDNEKNGENQEFERVDADSARNRAHWADLRGNRANRSGFGKKLSAKRDSKDNEKNRENEEIE